MLILFAIRERQLVKFQQVRSSCSQLDIVHAQARAEKEAQLTAEAPALEPAPEADTPVPDVENERPNTGADGAVPTEAGPVSADEMQVDAKDGSNLTERREENGAGTAPDELVLGEELGTAAAERDEDVAITEAVKDLEGAREGEPDDEGGMQAGAVADGRDAGGSSEAARRETNGDGGVPRAGVEIDGGRDGEGRSTANEIADSLVATGLVEEGDAAKVEARALARVVALEAIDRNADGSKANTKDGEGGEAGVRESSAVAVRGAEGGGVGALVEGESERDAKGGVPSEGDAKAESRHVEEGSRAEEIGSERVEDGQGPEKLGFEAEGNEKVEIGRQVEKTTDGVMNDAARSDATGAQEIEVPDAKPELS